MTSFTIPLRKLFPEEYGARKQGKCPKCHTIIHTGEFLDSCSYDEYQISGLCQKCQDIYFTEEEDDYVA